MAIYKSSHHYPSLSEIDVDQPNEFSCQVNTSGESVQAYKIQILSGRGDEVVLDGNDNDGKGTDLSAPVKNKGFLKIPDSVFKNKSKLLNGKDYQWGIRTYASRIGSELQPKTLVCNGFIVGSTQYVIWINLDTSEIEITTPTEVDSSYLGGGWEFQNQIDEIKENLSEPISFTSNDNDYTQITIDKDKKTLSYDETIVYENGTWNSSTYKKIQIDNGQDISKSLISFIQEYASKISNAPYTKEQKNKKRAEIKDNINNLLQYDRYIEFKIPKSEISSKILPFPSTFKPEKDIVYPPIANDFSGEYYVQRRKIDWIEKDLGKNKTITKIETEENFDYNFTDGTQFSIYLCSDQHSPNAIYVDPNDIIEPSNYIVIYNSKTEYEAAKKDTANANDPTKGTIRNQLRKIYGYSSDTGEIRVQEAYGNKNDPIPVNGNYYRIFEYDMVNKIYKEKTGKVEQVVGGSELKVEHSEDLFKVYSNKWSNDTKDENRIFIQPNINIKLDRTNYNEIVFDDGTRVDIIPNDEENDIDEDDIFEKLDNTQWILKGDRIGLVEESGNLYKIDENNNINNILPKTNYSIYTDFMDSSPYEIFYARKSPYLNILFTNYNNPSNVLGINEDEEMHYVTVDYRDILFRTPWIYQDGSTPLQGVKYYQYKLYDEDGDLIGQSEETYFTDFIDDKFVLSWSFRGLETGDFYDFPRYYTIELVVIDEYGQNFYTNSRFGVYYDIQDDLILLKVNLDCEEKAISVETNTPIYVKSVNDENMLTVDENNIEDDYLNIPKGKVLNYTTIVSEKEEIPIVISENMSLLTKFQINGDFIDNIPYGEELEIIKFASKSYLNDGSNNFSIDEYRFTIGSFETFYIDNKTGKYMRNDNQFKFRWYKNNEVLTCWNDCSDNYIDLSLLLSDFIPATYIQSALQRQSDSGLYIIQLTEDDVKSLNKKNALSILEKSFQDKYPDIIIENGIKILLKETYDKNGNNITSNILPSGIYRYNNGWEKDYSVEYVFVDNLEVLFNIESNENYCIPEDCIDRNGNLYWNDKSSLKEPEEIENILLSSDGYVLKDSNGLYLTYKNNDESLSSMEDGQSLVEDDCIWIENSHREIRYKTALNETWFVLYFISNNAKENQYICELTVEKHIEK